MQHFLVLGSMLSPQWCSRLILTITLEDNTHFAEEGKLEWSVTELASHQGRVQTQIADASEVATSALTSNNFWLFTEAQESVSHFHSSDLYLSPHSATSPLGGTSGHLCAFNQTNREMEMKPCRADTRLASTLGNFQCGKRSLGVWNLPLKKVQRSIIIFTSNCLCSPFCHLITPPPVYCAFSFLVFLKLNGSQL